MILDRITLTNFRCFEHLDLPLDPHLNVFVGTNGSGKSTILQAIAIGLAPILDALPFSAITSTDEYQWSPVPRIQLADIHQRKDDQLANEASLKIVAHSSGSGRMTWSQTVPREPLLPNGPRELSHIVEAYDFAQSLVRRHDAGQTLPLPVFAYYGTNRGVDVPRDRVPDRQMPRFFRRLAGLEDALDASASFRRSIGWFDLLERQELRNLRDRQYPGQISPIEWVRRAITGMIDGVNNPRIDGDSGWFVVDYASGDNVQIKLHIDQLSDGYQALMGVVMDFASRLALANPPDQANDNPLESEAILIIDEVELHLHPAWQQQVVERLRQTFPNTQIILTTHSPQVLSTVEAKYIRQVVRAGNTSTISTPPYQTRGVGSATVLATALDVDQIPDVPEARKLSEYHNLIAQGTYDTAEGRQLRAELDAHFGPTHQLIIDLDRLIRFHEFKQRVAREKADHASA